MSTRAGPIETLDLSELGEKSNSHQSEDQTRQRKALVRAGLIAGYAGPDRNERSLRLADDIRNGKNLIR